MNATKAVIQIILAIITILIGIILISIIISSEPAKLTHDLDRNITKIETNQYYIEIELDRELLFKTWCRISFKDNNKIFMYLFGLDRSKTIKSIKNKIE